MKPGKVSLSVEGAALKVFCHLDGHRVQHLETVVSTRPAYLLARWNSTGFGSFVHRYAPGVNTSQSVVDFPVELWRISEPVLPSDSEGMGARACDISQTKLTWGSAAWADHNALPAREFVGAAYQEFTGAALSLWQPWDYKQSFVSEVDSSQFAPWVLSRYDHPSSFTNGYSRATRAKVLVAGKLAGSDLLTYRHRGEDRLGPMNMVDIRVSVDPKHYAELLPPGCEPVRASLIRLLVLRVEQGDFSSRPFQEVWLFALCHVKNHRRWYALSHVVGSGGEFLLGRERFGHPTLKGRVGVGVSATDFHFSGSRYGYEFVRGAGSFRRFSTGLTPSRLNIVSLRARPFRPDVQPQAELIGQTWFIQGRLHYADLRTVELVFSDGLGMQDNVSGLWFKDTPWFKVGQLKVISAEAMEDAYMQRGPGHIVRDVPDFEPFYRERCDGVLPHEVLSNTSM